MAKGEAIWRNKRQRRRSTVLPLHLRYRGLVGFDVDRRRWHGRGLMLRLGLGRLELRLELMLALALELGLKQRPRTGPLTELK